MELILDDRYKISSDKMNYTLERLDDVKDRETGEIVDRKWKDVGYFGQNLSHALKRYATEKIREEDKLNIDKLVNVLKGLEQHIEKVVKKRI